jgi:hypothetical protein
MSQVQWIDDEQMFELIEVGLFGKASKSVFGKARRANYFALASQ